MIRRNLQVEALAEAHTRNIPAVWKFRATGDFIVNDQDTESYVGEFWYQNGEFEIGPAIQVRDWVFCLERRRLETRQAQNLPDDWIVGAFHNSDHFSFNCRIQENYQRNVEFMRYVCCTFWPILHPETFDNLIYDDQKEKSIRMEFKTRMHIFG